MPTATACMLWALARWHILCDGVHANVRGSQNISQKTVLSDIIICMPCTVH